MTTSSWKEQASSFVHQLMLPEQRQLFDYWKQLPIEGRSWPSVSAMKPAELPRKLLPHVLLIEPRPAPESIHVRLAGSALWDIYGGELTGATLAQGIWKNQAACWRRIYERMMEQPMPDSGHIHLRDRFSVLFWLRLPLLADNGDVWLLGLDVALPASHVEGLLARGTEESTSPFASARSPMPEATNRWACV